MLSDEAQIDGLCRGALSRLGFGSLTELRKFWEAVEVDEVAAWAERDTDAHVPVRIEAADGGWTSGIARADIEDRLSIAPQPTSRLRILNPFDPAIRDRARVRRLFGFDYTWKCSYPPTSVSGGIMSIPLLEGDRLVGRVEARAERAAGRLRVLNLWWEPGVRPGSGRRARLEAELSRLARLAGVDDVIWD